jgi:hypothetical protein
MMPPVGKLLTYLNDDVRGTEFRIANELPDTPTSAAPPATLPLPLFRRARCPRLEPLVQGMRR